MGFLCGLKETRDPLLGAGGRTTVRHNLCRSQNLEGVKMFLEQGQAQLRHLCLP